MGRWLVAVGLALAVMLLHTLPAAAGGCSDMGPTMLMADTTVTATATVLVPPATVAAATRLSTARMAVRAAMPKSSAAEPAGTPVPASGTSHHLGCQGLPTVTSAVALAQPSTGTPSQAFLTPTVAPHRSSRDRAPPDLHLLLGVSRT